MGGPGCTDCVLCFSRLQDFVVKLVAKANLYSVPASLPFIEPCRPRPVKRLPTGDAWLHEPKLDGWRLQAVKRGKDVALYSRNGRDLADRYDIIAEAVQKLAC